MKSGDCLSRVLLQDVLRNWHDESSSADRVDTVEYNVVAVVCSSPAGCPDVDDDASHGTGTGTDCQCTASPAT